MKVAPHSVSGRVVNTSRASPDSVRKVTSAPSLRPIQFTCIALTRSGQSRPSKFSSSSA
jgi:hypothetical protein